MYLGNKKIVGRILYLLHMGNNVPYNPFQEYIVHILILNIEIRTKIFS